MIETRIESARGCGYRKAAGLYLVGGKLSNPCGRLPIPLTTCPTCMAGIKFSRGFSWISSHIVEASTCSFAEDKCKICSPWYDIKQQKFGLLWVGEKFYPRPADFIKEGNMAGVSKRIAMIPRDLVVGETWILLAHRKDCLPILSLVNAQDTPIEYTPGIFAAFVPTAIEYVVRGDETPEQIASMEKRGITLVNVIPDTKTQMNIEQQPKRKTRKSKAA